MLDNSLLPHRLSLKPDFFRDHALHVLTEQRARLIVTGECDGWASRIEAIPAYGDRVLVSSVRNELERCDKAIRDIEAQRVE